MPYCYGETRNNITIKEEKTSSLHIPTTKKLKVDNIKNLDDIKRVLDLLDIHIADNHENFEKVKDLFE